MNLARDLTHLTVYTIDPEGCTDADDAFAYQPLDDRTERVYVFIADPTLDMGPPGPWFESIVKKATTRYYPDREPDHLLPKDIVDEYTLMTHPDNTDPIRRAICVSYIVTDGKFQSEDPYFCNIVCLPENRYTYEAAAALGSGSGAGTVFQRLVELSKRLAATRGAPEQTIMTIPKVKDGTVTLHRDSPAVHDMHQMIAELAIITNVTMAKTVGGIFRACPSAPGGQACSMVDVIIAMTKGGIKGAAYSGSAKKHEIIGDTYMHFTSPLRRAADLIAHYIFRHQQLRMYPPFTPAQLESYLTTINSVNKAVKKEHFKEQKTLMCRALQPHVPFILACRMTGEIKGWLNIMLVGAIIGDVHHNIQISYCIKLQKRGYTKYGSDETFYVNVDTINLKEKFDEKILPDVAAAVLEQDGGDPQLPSGSRQTPCCSLCGAPGTNKSTCPRNALSQHPNPQKHY